MSLHNRRYAVFAIEARRTEGLEKARHRRMMKIAGMLALGAALLHSMNGEEKAKALREARERSGRCRDWLKTLIPPGYPKPAANEELFAVAEEKLAVHRSNFSAGRDRATWDMGPQDLCNPPPRRGSRPQGSVTRARRDFNR